jgi:predicted nucleic acid-binding protein
LSTQVLVDTCSFIDYFRGAEDSLIPYLAVRDTILLSKVVRLELLKGARRNNRKVLLDLFDGFKQLSDFPPSDLTEQVLLRLHGRGLNLGFADLLILTDVMRSRSGLLTSDRALANAARVLKLVVVANRNQPPG